MTTEKRRSVLIVDPDTSAVAAFKAALDPALYAIQVSDSGVSALEILRDQEGADVLIAAYLLPDMSGLDLLSQAMTLYPDIVAVSVAETSSLETALEGMRRGVAEYLAKPLSLGDFGKLLADRIRERDEYIAGKSKVKEVMAQLMPVPSAVILVIARPAGEHVRRPHGAFKWEFSSIGGAFSNIPRIVKRYFWDID